MFGVFYHGAFGQLAQEVRDTGSGLLRHQPDVVVLAPLTGVVGRPGDFSRPVEHIVDEAWSHVTALRERFNGLLLLQNMSTQEGRPFGILDARRELGRADFVRSVNLHLSRRCRETGLAYILDVQFLAGLAGAVWPGLHKQHLMAGRPLADVIVSQLAPDIAAFCAALKGFARKCLVVDLDNTLWGGVVGEEGVAGVNIGGTYPGNLYTALQTEIKMLHERGVTLAIVSKNNEADAWEVFDQRSEMVLNRADFSAHRINWRDKGINLRDVASELQIDLDALVLLDDNPVERALIEELLPQVEVCPASDPLEMLRWLTTCRRFDTLAITTEDALRAKSHAASVLRRETVSNVDDLEGYLTGLGTEVQVGALTTAQIARVAQLTQKTNQFNLTTRRLTEKEVQDLMSAPDWRVFWCRCRDRFADEGLIGAAIVKIEDASWRLHTFLMSCRVLGRGIEKAFLHAICQHAVAQGAGVMIGEFIRTAKNSQTETFFESCGFTVQQRTPDHCLSQLSLPSMAELKPRWIAMNSVETITASMSTP
ncbi:MAG: HAD-IIIC family phosphatase [Acidobacteriota bacterium]